MILTSKNNPLIKETVSLKEKKGRKQHGLFLVEGVKMVKECLRSSLQVERIILAEHYDGDTEFLNGYEDITVCVSDDVLCALCDEKTPQGIRICVENTAKATELIVKNPHLFTDYELTKGKMDDVFLAVTGKTLVGGGV